jgi:hypothetical protein
MIRKKARSASVMGSAYAPFRTVRQPDHVAPENDGPNNAG